MPKQSFQSGSRFVGDNNPVAAYLKDIRLSGKLSSEEEKALALRIRKGDRKALRALIEANLKFVVAVCRNYENQGLPMADLSLPFRRNHDGHQHRQRRDTTAMPAAWSRTFLGRGGAGNLIPGQPYKVLEMMAKYPFRPASAKKR